MDQTEAADTSLGETGLPRSPQRTGFSDFCGSMLLLRDHQIVPMLIAGARSVGHGVAVPGLAQMECKGFEEVGMPAAPS